MDRCNGRPDVTLPSASEPVVVELDPGFATLGKFSIMIHLNGAWSPVGPGRGDLGDDIPDLFVLPADPPELVADGTRLMIVGNYAPAFPPTGKQVRVHYVFSQAGAEIHRERIERDGVELVKCDHIFRFIGGPG